MNGQIIRYAQLICLSWIVALPTWAGAQQFTLGTVRTLPDARPSVPVYAFCPDGHIPLLKDGKQLQMYWAGGTSYRTVGRSIDTMRDPIAVLESGPKGSFDNGGTWLFSVFRQDGDRMLGFYHAEDHEFAADPNSKYVAWKSIARCTSDDNGKTWQKDGQIITSDREKPDEPTWGGAGDCSVVWDDANKQWVCFYQEHVLCMAVSADPDGKPGTWKKAYGFGFTEPGLGGEYTPIASLSKFPGGNPSVYFNTFLKKWVMVWHTWDTSSAYPNSIWLSTSDDLMEWNTPQIVVAAEGNARDWYPVLLGDTDQEGGKTSLLCYAHFADKDASERQFVVRTITFQAEAEEK
jgi:hypothetical protein